MLILCNEINLNIRCKFQTELTVGCFGVYFGMYKAVQIFIIVFFKKPLNYFLKCTLVCSFKFCVCERERIIIYPSFCSFNSCSEGHLALMLQQPVAVHTPPGLVCTSRTASESEQISTGNKRADIWHEWVHNDLFDLSVSLWFSELSEEMAQCWVYELAHLVHSA